MYSRDARGSSPTNAEPILRGKSHLRTNLGYTVGDKTDFARKICLRTNKGFPEIPLKRGNGYLFLCLKEKGRKRSRPTFRWIVAPINCVARIFSVPESTVPQMAVSSTPENKRLEALGSRNGGFDLMGAVRIRLHHANHGTQTVWVCVPRFVEIMIKWMQGCADGASSPPLGNLFPPCAVDSFPVRRRHTHSP